MTKNKIIAKNKKHLEQLIKKCIAKEGNNCDLNHIDPSLIKDMSQLFHDSNFNGNLSNWNVSAVKYINGIFANSKFNGDISNWNVSNVKYMSFIFDNSQIKIIPYWAKIENYKERQDTVIEYQETLENKKLLEKLIVDNSHKIIHKI